jgi:hypothetical protein
MVPGLDRRHVLLHYLLINNNSDLFLLRSWLKGRVWGSFILGGVRRRDADEEDGEGKQDVIEKA